MPCDEGCRTAVFGKTERTVGWEGNGDPVMTGLLRHCTRGNPQRTDRPGLPPLTHSFTLDIVCHCRSEAQARALREVLEARFEACELELHPQKTKIVYCKDANRRGMYPNQQFDFLGYTFRPRSAKNRNGELFVSFAPAVSDKAAKSLRHRIRRWRLHRRNDLALEDLAQWTRPVLAGWVRYYGRFHPSVLCGALRTLDQFLVRWVQRKYRRLRGHYLQAWGWLRRVKARKPRLFAHWISEVAVGR